MTMKHWQEDGVRLAGILVDAVEIIHQALPLVHQQQHRHEIERFLAGGSAPFPSPEALLSLPTEALDVKALSVE